MLLIVVVDVYCLPGFDQAEEETGMRKQGDRLASLGGNPHPAHRQYWINLIDVHEDYDFLDQDLVQTAVYNLTQDLFNHEKGDNGKFVDGS